MAVEHDIIKKKYTDLLKEFADYQKAAENTLKEYKDKITKLENEICVVLRVFVMEKENNIIINIILRRNYNPPPMLNSGAAERRDL